MKYTDIQDLIRAHYTSEDEFHNAIDKIIKSEEKSGKEISASKIKAIFNHYAGKKRDGYTVKPLQQLSALNKQNKNMCEKRQSNITLQDVILNSDKKALIVDAINEFKYKDELNKYGLEASNKLLLTGPPGVGKTWAALAIAGELSLDLVFVRWDSLISSYLGSTGNNIRTVFESASNESVVLFLDEFDSVGKERGGQDHEVGEMSRVVINLLQNIDMFPPESFLVAATNHGNLLDTAIWRRFLVVEMGLPDDSERRRLINYYSKGMPVSIDTEKWVRDTNGMSGADIKTKIHKEAKRYILTSANIKKKNTA